MRVVGLDQSVQTVKSVPVTVDLCQHVLIMNTRFFGPLARAALCFGPRKINLHQADNTLELMASLSTIGALWPPSRSTFATLLRTWSSCASIRTAPRRRHERA